MSANPITYYNSNAQTTIIQNNQPRVVGGVTSGVLRYPHLIQELIGIKQQEKEKLDTDVLILGPGLAKVDRVSSPQLHEILAAFPPQAHVTVVDRDDELITEIGKSTFGPVERNLAESVLTAYDGYSVSKYSAETINGIREYVRNIPEQVTQNLEVQQKDFENFKFSKKYDYIFALQSLIYQFFSYQQLNAKDEQTKSRLLIAKYLGNIKDNGTLIVDEMVYELMRNHFKALPGADALDKGEVQWSYKSKDTATPFVTRKVVIPNDSRKDNSKAGRLPSIYNLDQNGGSRDVSTTDVYLITRLPAK